MVKTMPPGNLKQTGRNRRWQRLPPYQRRGATCVPPPPRMFWWSQAKRGFMALGGPGWESGVIRLSSALLDLFFFFFCTRIWPAGGTPGPGCAPASTRNVGGHLRFMILARFFGREKARIGAGITGQDPERTHCRRRESPGPRGGRSGQGRAAFSK